MASMTPALEEVAMQWTNELSRVSSDLAIASRNLQKDFLMLSKAAADQQDDSNSENSNRIPDPVKLVRRICGLENSIKQLQQQCSDLSARREEVLSPAAQQMEFNRQMMNKLLEKLNPAELQQTTESSRCKEELEDRLREQLCILKSTSNES